MFGGLLTWQHANKRAKGDEDGEGGNKGGGGFHPVSLASLRHGRAILITCDVSSRKLNLGTRSLKLG